MRYRPLINAQQINSAEIITMPVARNLIIPVSLLVILIGVISLVVGDAHEE